MVTEFWVHGNTIMGSQISGVWCVEADEKSLLRSLGLKLWPYQLLVISFLMSLSYVLVSSYDIKFHNYHNSPFCSKNIFVYGKSMKIIFMNIIMQGEILGWIWSAQKLFSTKNFARKFTEQKKPFMVIIFEMCSLHKMLSCFQHTKYFFNFSYFLDCFVSYCSLCIVNLYVYTCIVVREFFACKIFCLLIFHIL